jgi:hypothetical protein
MKVIKQRTCRLSSNGHVGYQATDMKVIKQMPRGKKIRSWGGGGGVSRGVTRLGIIFLENLSNVLIRDITHDPPLSTVAQGIFGLSTERLSRSTLHLKEGERGVGALVLCSLATVTSCIDLSVWIVTKSPKVRPLILHLSGTCLEASKPCGSGGEGLAPGSVALLLVLSAEKE